VGGESPTPEAQPEKVAAALKQTRGLTTAEGKRLPGKMCIACRRSGTCRKDHATKNERQHQLGKRWGGASQRKKKKEQLVMQDELPLDAKEGGS